jgi:hypothetical protein
MKIYQALYQRGVIEIEVEDETETTYHTIEGWIIQKQTEGTKTFTDINDAYDWLYSRALEAEESAHRRAEIASNIREQIRKEMIDVRRKEK